MRQSQRQAERTTWKRKIEKEKKNQNHVYELHNEMLRNHLLLNIKMMRDLFIIYF